MVSSAPWQRRYLLYDNSIVPISVAQAYPVIPTPHTISGSCFIISPYFCWLISLSHSQVSPILKKQILCSASLPSTTRLLAALVYTVLSNTFALALEGLVASTLSFGASAARLGEARAAVCEGEARPLADGPSGAPTRQPAPPSLPCGKPPWQPP